MTILTLVVASAVATTTNPIAKVIGMVSDLQQKVVGEGAEAQKIYNEFAEMCEDRSQGLHNEIKTGKAQVGELTAAIEKAVADTAVTEEKISDFASEVSEAEASLKSATGIRAKENADFAAAEKELMATISTIERATSIVEKEMNGGASLAQTQVSNMDDVVQALSAMVDAQALNSADGANLMAFVQSSAKAEEDSDDMGAPSAAAYKSKSGGIVGTLEDLLSKAEGSLDDARKAETNSLNSFQMQKQSLDDKISFANKELGEAKKALAATAETQATATGDLDVTKKDLKEDINELAELHHECLTEATSFEESTKSRGEELKALAEAKKIIQESTGGASGQTYLAQTSFMQVASKDGETAMAVNMVRHLAIATRSQSLSQLAARMQSAGNSANPFGKVTGLIKSMIEKLMDEADAGATKKAYCDKEMAESKQNQEDKETAIEKLSTQVDVMSAESKKLKGEVGALQKELAALTKTQAEMDKLRAEEKAIYTKNKPELERGIKGVQTALKVLRDYYAQDKDHDAADGAGSGIIGLLEVCESDFSKGLAEMNAAEEASASEYETATNENNVGKAAKEQDVKYKTKTHVGLDKSIAELKADRTGVNDELAAVNEYFAGIKKECVAKAEPYEEKVKRRNAEIAGLKDALATLDGDASLLQRSSVHKTLRGAKAHQQ